jgi:hypothetical protein
MFCGHRGADHAKAVLLSEIRAMIKMRKESDEDLQNAKDLLGRLLAAEGSRVTPPRGKRTTAPRRIRLRTQHLSATH